MHYFNVEQKYTRKYVRKLLWYAEPEKLVVFVLWITSIMKRFLFLLISYLLIEPNIVRAIG
ncbi:hypothetical protein DW604_12935 [Enterococcus faecium]|nr:hypothetical protein [Enterococcus faecium]EGP5656674.1 hypothetical protein [Enterococcus faecium]